VKFADTHVHIDAYEDPLRELELCQERGVVAFVATTRPTEFRRTFDTYAQFECARIGLGLHPEAAGSVYEPHELAVYAQQLDRTRWISEIGLDGVIAESVGSFFGSAPSLSVQTVMLERILGLGVEGKVLSLHSRGAEQEVLDLVRAARPDGAIFHWYRGGRETAKQIIEHGYLFSVNIEMIRDVRTQPFLRWLPTDAILMETDGPFTTVSESVLSHPADIEGVVHELAAIRGEDWTDLASTLEATFARLDEPRAEEGSNGGDPTRNPGHRW